MFPRWPTVLAIILLAGCSMRSEIPPEQSIVIKLREEYVQRYAKAYQATSAPFTVSQAPHDEPNEFAHRHKDSDHAPSLNSDTVADMVVAAAAVVAVAGAALVIEQVTDAVSDTDKPKTQVVLISSGQDKQYFFPVIGFNRYQTNEVTRRILHADIIHVEVMTDGAKRLYQVFDYRNINPTDYIDLAFSREGRALINGNEVQPVSAATVAR